MISTKKSFIKIYAVIAFIFVSLLFVGVTTWKHRGVDLTIIGAVNMADGLGRQSVELFNALKEDLKINIIPTGKINLTDVPNTVLNSIESNNPSFGKMIIFEDCLWYPGFEGYKKLPSLKQNDQIRIAYSMFESTRIPSEWAKILNDYFDVVVVPDPFLIDVYIQSGVTIPIFVLPLGLDLSNFFLAPVKKKASSPFIFGFLSSCLERKNHPLLVRAFAKKFKNNPNVFLLINCRNGDPASISALKAQIQDLGLDNVLYTQLTLDKATYLSLFQNIDCYVSLTKGEGFSIQPREALALGIPTIVTNNTGQTTICNANHVLSVASSIKEPAKYFWGGTYGSEFNCDEDAAARALQEVYDHYPVYLERAQLGREWVKQYQFSNLKGLYKSLVRPKKIVLGDQNLLTEEYLMTNSSELYEKYQKLIY